MTLHVNRWFNADIMDVCWLWRSLLLKHLYIRVVKILENYIRSALSVLAEGLNDIAWKCNHWVREEELEMIKHQFLFLLRVSVFSHYMCRLSGLTLGVVCGCRNEASRYFGTADFDSLSPRPVNIVLLLLLLLLIIFIQDIRFSSIYTYLQNIHNKNCSTNESCADCKHLKKYGKKYI